MKDTDTGQGVNAKGVWNSAAVLILKAYQRLRNYLISLPFPLVLLSLLLGLAVTFVASHFLIQHSDKDLLNDYQQSVSATTNQLHEIIMGLFARSALPSDKLCSQVDLEMMRSYLWDHHQIKEVARIQNGQVICSASWGVLPSPVQLPAPTKSWPAYDFHHWRNTQDVIQGTVNVFMIANKDILIVMSPSVYANNFPNQESVGFIVSTADGYVTRAEGPLEAESVLAEKGTSLAMLIQQSCNSKTDGICVTVYNSSPGLLGKSKAFIGFLCTIALVLSTLIYVALLAFVNYRNSMKKALKRALKRKELFVYFQPKIKLNTGVIVGMEALARWYHERFGHVSPDVFITFAEENGLMPRLSRLVIEKALDSAGNTLQQHPHLTLSINLTMADLSDPTLLDFIDYHRQKYNIETGQLIFEITEISVSGFDQIEASVERFVSRGYKISLDDFGTGYANLSWLSKIKAVEIKVDRSFTQMIGSQGKAPLDAIFNLLRDLKVSAVFEGLENQDQVDYILAHVEEAIGQGWLFAQAMPIDELSRFILEGSASFRHSSPMSMQPLLECE